MIPLLSFIIKVSVSLIALIVFTHNSKEKINPIFIVSVGLISTLIISIGMYYNDYNILGYMILFLAFSIWFVFYNIDSVMDKIYILISSIIGIFFGFGNLLIAIFVVFLFFCILNYHNNIISFFNPDEFDDDNENII